MPTPSTIPAHFETRDQKEQRHVKEFVYHLMTVHRCTEAEAWQHLALLKAKQYARSNK